MSLLPRNLILCPGLLLAGIVPFLPDLRLVHAQGSQQDYDRALSLVARTDHTVYRDRVQPNWLGDGQRFWYRVQTGREAWAYRFVDAGSSRPERRPLVDHGSLARALGAALDQPIHPDRLPLDALRVDGPTAGLTLRFRAFDHGWSARLGLAGLVEELRKDPPALPEPAAPPTRSESDPAVSPDHRWGVEVRNHNLVLKDLRAASERTLTGDGVSTNGYSLPVWWSPDGSHLAVLQTRSAEAHPVSFVESSPRDRVQPRLHTHDYLKPGDGIAVPSLRIFRMTDAQEVRITSALFPNPYQLTHLAWSRDSRAFTFLYNQRGHQVLRWISLDPATGVARVLVEESQPTFIDYAYKLHLDWIEEGKTALWMSERDGWNHLWMMDTGPGADAARSRCLTPGRGVVQRVEHLDRERGQVWFEIGGVNVGEDPYHVHLGRVNLDGTGFALLTRGDGTHSVQFSPDRRCFIDTWSRVDAAPVSVLRRASDGEQLCALEQADISALLATGWTLPERFTAKGRDGQTDIHGILIHPSTGKTSPGVRPIVEEVYAGPQGHFVPKAFSLLLRQHAIAELGFVVVQADGMGTSGRSKAFHDVCWKNLADAGFPDRKAWIRAAAATHPDMDLSRVGIYGGSAGGQSAVRALLDHHDFYRVAVADCGCHDNRMDKIWWNELWMGWPVDESYVRSSNIADAWKLKGHLLLVVGEMDTNVDPASTYQLVDALERADRDFELLVMTGTGHGAAETAYGSRRRMDYLVRHLHGREPR